MLYCFKVRETGEPVEIVMSASKILRLKRKNGWKLPDGRMADRDHAAEMTGQKSGESRGYPYFCESSGVTVNQIENARQESIRNGVPTDFTPDGRAVIRDAGHRKKYLKSIRMFDKNAYY